MIILQHDFLFGGPNALFALSTVSSPGFLPLSATRRFIGQRGLYFFYLYIYIFSIYPRSSPLRSVGFRRLRCKRSDRGIGGSGSETGGKRVVWSARQQWRLACQYVVTTFWSWEYVAHHVVHDRSGCYYCSLFNETETAV